MERLTERNPLWINDEMWLNACEPDDEEIEAVYHKLKEYEDLEDRLNKVYDCDSLLLKVVETIEKHPKLLTDEEVDKWEEYKRLEEQGRLVKLPCKVGDVVYRINAGAMKPVIPLRVVEYRFKIVGNCIREKICCSDDFLCKQPSIIYYTEDVGDKVFLTKQKAESKLKELRGESIEDD